MLPSVYLGDMTAFSHSYKRLGIVALLTFILLVALQITWLYRAANSRISIAVQELALLTPDIALNVNAIDHDTFHAKKDRLIHLPDSLIEKTIQHALNEKGVSGEVFYAIYEDSLGEVRKTNLPAKENAWLESEAKACLSCIVSFSTISPDEANLLDREVLDDAELLRSSTFQYYSPVVGGDRDDRQKLWLALDRPHVVSETLGSMILLFAVNVFLLALLLGLFYYLLRSLNAYRSLTEVKEVFFNNVTHEFKTPLSSIRLASRMLLKKSPDEKSSEYLKIIDNESVALENQIDKLLELSLLDHKKIDLDFRDLDLAEMLQSLSKNLKPIADKKKANIQIDVAEDIPFMKGDHYHLSNAFSNLIENSIKYGHEGVAVRVGVSKVNDKVQLLFKDDGPGIDAEHQTHVFDRFYRAQHSSLGIGYALANA